MFQRMTPPLFGGGVNAATHGRHYSHLILPAVRVGDEGCQLLGQVVPYAN